MQKYFKNSLWASSAIVFLGVLVYANTFSNSFHFDDFKSILSNPSLRNILDFKAIWNFWPTRFVTYLSFALSYHFSKLNVFGYHFFNLIIHLANALLVWKLTLLTFRTPLLKDKKITSWAYPIAFFTGLIFVAHPIQTQAVTYIVQRTTSLAVFFYLASFVLYVQSRLTDKKVFYAGSLIAAILAMFTKEMAITLPFMVLFYENYFLKEKKLPWKTLVHC